MLIYFILIEHIINHVGCGEPTDLLCQLYVVSIEKVYVECVPLYILVYINFIIHAFCRNYIKM